MQILALESSSQTERKLSETLAEVPFNFYLHLLHEGESCLKTTFNEKIDVLIVSQELDDMSGYEFCSHLNNLVDKNHILSQYPPAIILIHNEKELTHEEKKQHIQAGISASFCRDNPAKLNQYLINLHGKQNSEETNRYKILLIEDSKSMRHHAKQCLQLLNADVIGCDSAEQALAELYDTDFDLIITSLVLKGKLTGKSLIKTVRHLEGSKANLPILVVSSSEDNIKKIELLKTGASDFIHKPFIPQEFIARAKNLIDNKKLLTQIELQSLRLQEMALTDHLTKLYNRHYLMDLGPKKIAECIRHNIACSILVLDLDHFKLINDRYGHAIGDIVLKESAAMILSLCRETDIVARFGGEEFVILLSHCNIQSTLQKAEQIRKKIETLHPEKIPISVSIGAAEINGDIKDFFSLFQQADKMVYVAKENGRNQVRS